eukprot:168455-Rhodomonas_salina.1
MSERLYSEFGDHPAWLVYSTPTRISVPVLRVSSSSCNAYFRTHPTRITASILCAYLGCVCLRISIPRQVLRQRYAATRSRVEPLKQGTVSSAPNLNRCGISTLRGDAVTFPGCDMTSGRVT